MTDNNQPINQLMKNLKLIFFIIVLQGCSDVNPESGFESKLIKKHFTRSDRKELAKIISFVDSAVLSKFENERIDKAYHHYLDSILQLAYNDRHLDPLVFDQEKKYAFLFNLDSSSFNKIWLKLAPQLVATRDTTLYAPDNFVSLELNPNGEYVEMIKDMGDNNEYYNSLHEDIKMCGGLDPTNVSYFLHHHIAFDFTNPDNKLWAVVFLMTLEESVEMKVKRYLGE